MRSLICVILSMVLIFSWSGCSIPERGTGETTFMAALPGFTGEETNLTAQITVEDHMGNLLIDHKNYMAYCSGNFLTTEPILLPGGRYRLTQFVITGKERMPLLATPFAKSYAAVPKTKLLPLAFNISETKNFFNEVVLVPANAILPEILGYETWGFNLEAGEDIEFFLSLFERKIDYTLIPFEDTEWNLSITGGASEKLISLPVTSSTFQIKVPGTFSNYTLTIEKDNIKTFRKNFSREELMSYEFNPLKITLIESELFLSYDFENNNQLSQWTNGKITVSPNGFDFMGQYALNEATTLSLSGLPEHQKIRLELDLYLIYSWDGGSDHWRIILDGTTLFEGSFKLWGEYTYTLIYQHPIVTKGLLKHNNTTGTLGYYLNSNYTDKIIPITLEFDHTNSNLTLTFQGLNLSAITDESWGIDNVKIHLLR